MIIVLFNQVREYSGKCPFHILLTLTFLDWKISSGWLESWEGLLLVTDVSTTCAEAILRIFLSKRQSLTTVLLRTPVTHMIFFNKGMLLLGSNHFLIDIIFVVGSVKGHFPWRSWYFRQGRALFFFSFFVQFVNCILNAELGKRWLLRAMPCWNVTWINVESRYAIATPSELLKPAPVFKPMGSKAKSYRTFYVQFFPRFEPVTGNC